VNSSEFKYPSPLVINFLRKFVYSISKILWRIEYHGTENIPQNLEGGLLIAPNHQTYIDPFWICVKIPGKLRFMAWDRAFDWALIGNLIQYLGAFPVSLEGREMVKAARKAIEVLREGARLIIFPEGEREFSDGKMLTFKPGAVRIAMEAEVPILPVTIRGANKVWSQDMKFPHLGKVKIIYHPIFKVSKPSDNTELDKHIKTLNEELAQIIGSEMY
jgi:1-acyl-sn-glycerol-3-phosphate acyltransferase